MATSRVCTIPGCGKPYVAKGYCRMHYARAYKNGSPHRGPSRKQKIVEFVQSVVLPNDSNNCLAHPFSKNSVGYCYLRDGGISMTLHRYVCEKVHGPAPEGRNDAAHECGNHWCVNPRHLTWKTRVENMHDKKRHGTNLHGEKQWQSKLTEDQVRLIRELAKTTSQREIARRFGLGYKHVWHVIHDTWKHVR